MPWPPALGAEVDLYLGAWTDASAYVYQRNPMQITRGRQGQSSTMSPSQLSVSLKNGDGRFTIRNPAGAWYGTIGQNTPLRVSVPNSLTGGGTYLRIEDDTASYLSCPDAAGLDITGSIDMRIDVALSTYVPTVLAAKYDIGGFRSWAWITHSDGTLEFFWTPDGSVGAFVSARSTAPMPIGRTVLQVTVNNGGSSVVTFATAAGGNADAGPFTQLGAQVTVPLTAVFNSAARVSIGQAAGFAADFGTGYAGLNGQVLEYELRSGVGGTVVAHPMLAGQTAGATSFADTQGNTWTVHGTAELSNRLYRYHGELAALPKTADPGLRDTYSDATASGMSRRLQQQQSPLNSAMYRAYTRLAAPASLVAYWPMEDGPQATTLASALPGQQPLAMGSPLQLAGFSGFACSAPIPVLNSGNAIAAVATPAGTTWTSNVIRFLMAVPSGGDTNGGVLVRIGTTGTISVLDLVYGTGGTLQLAGNNAAGTQVVNSGGVAFAVNGQLLRVSIELTPSGSDVKWNILTVAPGAVSGLQFSGTLVGASIGKVVSVETNTARTNLLTGTAIGHLSVQAAVDTLFDLGAPLNAWNGESAGFRFLRLCREEGVPCRIYGFYATSVAMGNQTQQTLWQLLQECETTDMGMMFEPRTCLGLGYIPLSALVSQSADATAVFGSGGSIVAPFQPTSDDLSVINDVTISNADGSSARMTHDTGAMSTLPPPAGVGRVDTQVTVNAANDSDLPSLAKWLLHVSVVNDDRYPAIQFNLARNVTGGVVTPAAVPLLDVGSYLQVTGTPAWVPPGPVKQLCAGFSEILGAASTWTIAVNGVPETPYETGILDDLVYGHADTDGSTLAAGVSSGATSLSVATTNAASPLWTTTGGDFPFDISIGGEQITVTNITGSSSPQTFTVTRSVNGVVKAQLSGADVRLFFPMILALT